MVTFRAMFEDFDKNDFFDFLLFFNFSLDEACFGVDLDCCTCVMDMADGALEMLDVMLFSRGIGAVVVACFVANGPGSFTRPRMKFPNFSIFFRFVC